MKTSLLLFQLLLFSSTLFSATITFNNGTGNFNWEEPGNWDLNRVPKNGDDVIITTGFFCQVSNTNNSAQATTISLTGGILHVNGVLHISNGTSGISSTAGSSFLKVNGTLIVENISGGPALDLIGNMNISSTGQLFVNNIDAGSNYAVDCRDGSSQGNIEITNSTNGILINGRFSNQGNLDVHDVSGNAFRIAHLPTTDNKFTNEGLLDIYDIGDLGLMVQDSFVNNGIVEIDRIDETGIDIFSIGKLINNSDLTVSHCKINSAKINGDFDNYGTLEINQEAFDILRQEIVIVYSEGNFRNFKTLNITNPAVNHPYVELVVQGPMRNSTSGTMNIDRVNVKIISGGSNAGSFVNSGYIFIDGTHEFFANTINNQGIIISSDEQRNTPNFNNTTGVTVHLQKLNKFEVGVAALDVFQGNELLEFTDELFIDQALTISAGSLFNNNVWIPSGASAGYRTFFAEFDNGIIPIDTVEFSFKASVKSGDNIWTNNAGNKDWSDGNNWSLNHPPTASEFALINDPSDIVIIQDGTNAQSLDVICHGDLTIEPGGELLIQGAHERAIKIEATGVFKVEGILNIADHSGSVAIEDDGVSSNSGTITIENSAIGIKSKNFANSGTIRLKYGDHGIQLYDVGSIFNNSGNIFLTEMNIEVGYNATFNNLSSGLINIDKAEDYFIGFIGGSTTNPNTFNNHGSITAKSSDQNGITGSKFEFNNFETGSIELKKVFRSNLKIGGTGPFPNNLPLGPVTFNNHGHLDISETGKIYNGASVNEDVGGLTILSNGKFINHPCGTVLLDAILEMPNGSGTFTNEGIFKSIESQSNLGSFGAINNGVILDENNVWLGQSYQNNGATISPISTPVLVGQNVSNLFATGDSMTAMSSAFYSDEQLTIWIGDYDQTTNSWLPNSNATGIAKVYFEMDYGNCTDVDFFRLDLPVVNPCGSLTWIGQNGDWDNTANWNLDRLPAYCDTININGGALVTIPSGVTANVSVIRLFDGNLNIQSGATLNISTPYGLSMEGESNSDIENYGTINIDNTLAGIQLKDFTSSFYNDGLIIIETNTTGIGLVDGAQFENESGAEIIIVGGNISIAIPSDGSEFLNEGTVNIASAKTGISLDDLGAFSNSGVVNINALSD